MSKADRKPKRPNIAPAALLRARLEAAWLAESAAGQAPEQLAAALQAASYGLKPALVISVVLSAFEAARPEVQAKLETALPAWLAQRDGLGALETLITKDQLTAAQKATGLRWLAATGREVVTLTPSAASTFHSAYLLEGEWQTAVIILWYSNPQRSRARGLEVLIDGNPPWDWAVKEVMLLPNKPPETLIERYVDMWKENGPAMTPMDAPALKRRLVVALRQNEAAHIRLPADLIGLREVFFEHVLSLPDGPDTPAFSADDFDRLSTTGQSAEEVSRFEQTVARRIRLDDGQEVLVDPSLAEMDFGDWDDEAG
jgi:hypothetical protein